MSKISAIIFSSLNKNTLSRLTSSRTVAAIPFACRYRLIDFCISNLVNARISDISIVANYNYQSLLRHIGSGKDFDLARSSGGINFVSPFQCIGDISEAKMFSTHLEALKSMSGYINESESEYFILMDSDTVLNLDLNAVVASLEEACADITFVTKLIDEQFTSKNPRLMFRTENNIIVDASMSSRFDNKRPEMSIGIIVVRRLFLCKLIEDAIAHNYSSLTQFILRNFNKGGFYSYEFKGFCATVSSFLDYYKYSMELVNNSEARNTLLGNSSSSVYTKIHNSAPKYYKKGAEVKNSILADEEYIEGTIINSVIFRGVVIESGAIVKNSILFHGTHVAKGAKLNCIVTDKDVYITENTELSGSENMPFYVQKGRKV